MRTITTASLLAFVLALSVSQNGCGGTKAQTVSVATIAQLPSGKMFEIDLTKKGTVYEFNDAGTDFSRVAIRSSRGAKIFGELLKTSNTSLKGGLVLSRRVLVQ